jgi:hypothetical protein
VKIIWNKEVAETLKQSHTVLELETFTVDGKPVQTFCVVSAENIGISGFATLENTVKMHETFIAAFNSGNYGLCSDCVGHLIGQFGGELDSFYITVMNKIKKS